MSGSATAPAADGWVEELNEAVREAREDRASAARQLRVARAACKLRQWNKCRKAARRGLALRPADETEKRQLGICQGIAEKEEAALEGSYVTATSGTNGLNMPPQNGIQTLQPCVVPSTIPI